MRFAVATTDRYLGVFEALVHAGWQPVKLFTLPVKPELTNSQLAVTNYALRSKAAIQVSRIMKQDIRNLRDMGCEALVVAGYEWKVPDWEGSLKYAVNFHCSPLPEGRGHYPPVRAILENWTRWGVTCHQLSQEFDKGNILAAEMFALGPDECHDRLDLKIQMAARKLATRVANEFVDLWESAKPQLEGSYWPKLKPRDRIIDFQKPVQDILRHVRAFGTTGSLAHVNKLWVTVPRAIGWAEKHRHAPGTAVHFFNRSIVVAASDGYIGLLEAVVAPQNIVAEL